MKAETAKEIRRHIRAIEVAVERELADGENAAPVLATQASQANPQEPKRS